MSTYVVHADRTVGLFAEFVVRNTRTRRPVTRCATPAAARAVADALNARHHTRHRRRYLRPPLWYVSVMASLRTTAISAFLVYVFGLGALNGQAEAAPEDGSQADRARHESGRA